MAMNFHGVGRLARKPELKTYEGNKVMAKFSVAVDNDDKKGTTSWFDCTVFNQATAEYLEKNANKGTLIEIVGTMTYMPAADATDNSKKYLNLTISRCKLLANFGKNQRTENESDSTKNNSNAEDNPFAPASENTAPNSAQTQQPTAPAPAQTQQTAAPAPVSDDDLQYLFN